MKFNILLLFCCLVLFACHKDQSGPAGRGPDITVTAGLQGIVTDSSGNAVAGATVSSGGASTTTDANGLFVFDQIKLSGRFGFVKVEKDGYFTGSRTIVTNEGAMNYARIKLMQKVSAGSFSASGGGSVALPSGSQVSFESGSVMIADSKTAYTGSVYVYAHYLDPTAADISERMPGDLRGIDKNGAETGLQSFGMMAIELQSDDGTKLQIASGKKATITMAIPASLVATAPATIPLWYFNDTTGKWTEEGVATRSGSTYVGQVGHFSYWNCDAPCGVIYFKANVKDQKGNSVPYATFEFTATGFGTRSGYADSAGRAQGWILKGQPMTLKLRSECGDVILTKQISASDGDINLGDLVVSIDRTIVTLTGTVVNCSKQPVTNGMVAALIDGMIYKGTIADGHFSVNINRCATSATSIQLIASDVAAFQQGEIKTVTVTTGTLDVGELVACGTTMEQYIRFSLNGVDYSFTAPGDSMIAQRYSLYMVFTADRGTSDGASILMQVRNVDHAGDYEVAMAEVWLSEQAYYHTSSALKSMKMTITKYGEVNEYLEGIFSGTVSLNGVTNPVPLTGSFKLRRVN